jgi:hypothetical protein
MARKDTLNYTPPEFDNSSIDSDVDNFANPTNINLMDNIGLILTWTNVPVGIFEVYASNSKKMPTVIGDYTKLEFGAPINISALESLHSISLNQLPYAWLALRYVATSGTGNMTVIMNNKQVGG